MGTPQIDYGQAQITAFDQAARAGTLHFDEQVAHQAKHSYDQLINTLTEVRQKAKNLEASTGFGGFASAQELQRGFNQKATDGIAVIDKLIDAAIQLQQAYLRAANLYGEADQLNATRTAVLNDQLDTTGLRS